MVYELYFEQEFKKSNNEILKHLSNLKPINDEMGSEELLSIIQTEFKRLHYLEHPVRSAVEALNTIGKIRIINENFSSK